MLNYIYSKFIFYKKFSRNIRFFLFVFLSYSPFVNQIENTFSVCKNMVKRYNFKNESDFINVIVSGYLSITINDCQGLWRHMYIYIIRSTNEDMIFDLMISCIYGIFITSIT